MIPPLRYLFMPACVLALPLLLSACGDGGTGDDDDDDDSSTPDPGGLAITFDGLSEGGTIDQKETIRVTAPGATSLVFTAPAALAGKDSDSAPDTLVAQWDTTLEANGADQISVTATDASGNTVTKTLNVTRANPPAALAGRNYQDGDYIRYGSPLLINVQASAFGTTPSLKGVQVSDIWGDGISTTAPIDCLVQNDGTYTCNLGVPSGGIVNVVLNAVNNDNQLSEPLILALEVLRDDLLAQFLPYDFEVSPDGKTGLLLTSDPASPGNMRMEFLDLRDPKNPARYPEIVNLQTGISAGTTAAGNILVPKSGDKAYVLFPSNRFYAVTISTRTVAGTLTLNTPARPDAGAAIGHQNRSPYASITPDGKYVFAITTATPQLIMIDTTSMSQVDANPALQLAQAFTFPLTTSSGFGYMVPHPTQPYLYLVNNLGNDLNATSADLAVFSFGTKSFIDFNQVTPQTQPLSLESLSDYRIAQQPGVTSNGTTLIVPLCNKTTGVTKAKLVSLADPAKPSTGADIDLSTVKWGTVARVSDNNRYVLFATQQPGGETPAVFDLSSSLVVNATFSNGAMDGVFSPDSTTLFAESSDYVVRQMSRINLTTGAGEDLDVPGAAGLIPPATANDMRYNTIVRAGAYIYQVYAAYVDEGTGQATPKGTSLSVYDVAAGDFVFPNPLP